MRKVKVGNCRICWVGFAASGTLVAAGSTVGSTVSLPGAGRAGGVLDGTVTDGREGEPETSGGSDEGSPEDGTDGVAVSVTGT